MTPPGRLASASFRRPQGPDVALARRGLADPQLARRLLAAQPLEVPQREHLAVDRVEAVEHSWSLILVSARTAASLGRTSAPSNWAASAADDAIGHGPAVERDLAPGIADLGPQVMAVQRHQLLAREGPQPEEERDLGPAEVLVQAVRGLDEGLLDHVGRVDPAAQPQVEPQRDHPAQPGLVLHQEHPEARPVAPRRQPEQPDRLTRCVGHV